ncbi:MAG: DEAD/DEAH box helicase [Proteobacteria bacterium]|nr:DEAD/DEAH box helicase [Pseudomonadota bacterium]
MAGLERLHPHLQHAIVHDLGWRSLRPVQTVTIDAVLAGANAVVLAPTAGGKTEAAMFPVLSQILTDMPPPVAVLYICPIRALLNNQEPRLQQYARMVGLDVFKWHGDVSESRRQRFRDAPSHVLMTTPESLEVMLISARTDAQALFCGLSTVIIDEVHAFAGDDRGAHLAALLERISRMAGRDVQRIGLSATMGNPRLIAQWLTGSSARPSRLVDPPRGTSARDLCIDHCDDLNDAVIGMARAARGKKSLVFVESRANAERVAHALSGTGVEVFIHHSSVSRADRLLAEERFASGDNTAIVCTATMELGIDVGDLDQVLQVNAPATVASFLQRLGRTGRRVNTRSNCTFFCIGAEPLLQAIALVQLADQGWVEGIRPAEHALHVLAHQIMALTLQEGGVSRHTVLPWLAQAFPFAGVGDIRLQELVDTMLSRDILYEADGVLTLGRRGEELYGRRHFFELYAVFSSPPLLRVLHGRSEVGYLQASFVLAQERRDKRLCFRLAGRSWQVIKADWSRAVVHVRPAQRGVVPNWLGPPNALSHAVCQAIMAAVIDAGPVNATLTNTAAVELRAVRDSYQGLLATGSAPLEDTADGLQWHTFAGGTINRLLAAGLEVVTGKSWRTGNLSIRSKDVSLIEARTAIDGLRNVDWEQIAVRRAHEMARGLVSKFQPCLPEPAEDRLLAESLLDVPGTLRFLAQVRVEGTVIARADDLRRRLIDPLVDQPELPPPPGTVIAPAPTFAAKNPILFVDTGELLGSVCQQLANETALGLDVETTLDFQVVCIIQIARPGQTVVIDALAIGDLRPLALVLESPDVAKISHNASFEARMLAKLGFDIANPFDTLAASRRIHGKDALGGHGLAVVCERELGVTLSKAEQTSDWTRRPLTDAQLRYAAVDAEILLDLYARLSSEETPP